MSFYDDPNRQWAATQWEAPPPAGEPSSLRGLRTALTVLFVLVALISLLSVAAFAGRLAYVGDVIDSGDIDSSRAEDADAFVTTSTVLWYLVAIAIAAVFMVWQFRHARNARLLGAKGGVSSPGWAIGGWFIPLANAVIPAMNLYANGRASNSDGRHGAEPSRGGPGIVVLWAIVFWVVNGLARASWRESPEPLDSDYLEQLRTADTFALAGNVGYVVAAVLAIVMVRTLTARQEAALANRMALIGGPQQAYGSWPAPPPGSPYGQPGYVQPGYGPPPAAGYAPPQQPYGQPQPYSQPQQPPTGRW
ncbi:DUF4328 domain-containing protein [Jiangella anatolica]|uniref:DUF4328 domain-containing protein n=1 Tax=Jiangella anatolica TaxID=2670374 RepID=A0A2W2B3L1_9ACTN|nr:DUF4328 domain-containing protein [Jiangella anatolica]PZF80602.1 hypothetical protein C1I92_25330 [Jiangella anatolica]